MNLLHSIKAHKTDSLINVVIEIPSGSQSKIEYDTDKEEFVVDRILSTKLSFPFNYGFVPETWSNDNDPLDAVVLSSKPQNTGAVIESRIIGLLATKDEKGTDAKLITVPSSETNPIFTKINTIEDLDEQTLNNIQYFYKNYKIIEPGKWVDIDGYASKEEAESKLKIAIEEYHQHFQK
ncbi:TPA: inorganic pyrophosphatase [Candidatus Collierbacteria bacterium]|uniref:Inorganic pyrophosphatase n=1 Tax=Candidatus Collierbacteria bacterium GW2011_GWA2_42_17 TaxID=1618378 RepID=A0A0G0Z2Z3_9BACT|nr:MAG: Inorganic pyrophosphatase [Candidatus Collierbacteria bacterium GW2011_GWB2_42_12]KKS43122.1 MAG: Inorganic pyrophosphatase [Candidatus Collierbacteria bacterium GW2011_GWA2_42_17]KKS63111.1 MAG: Inorganic pyrophosphatase [Candidatus Collierbacteria bacterium GW2011_GWE2_42_48]KKS63411.1 MAG: Inorganic pyrophosphatase [Candidatus Collierbacteria bacterium GW2011_GWD2_42_50]KKS65100.1 MAG: Inorganic pyrophosphatase [Candidatus Collierbacteria bacterium GW2011_GWF2_42_51]KKS67656.1 MAG: 